MEGYPRTSNNCTDFRLLANAKDWVLPQTELRMKEWLSDPLSNKQKIDQVMATIVHDCSNVAILEFTASVFSDSPDLREQLENVIRNGYGVPEPNFITFYYYALASKNLNIKEAAEKWIPIMLNGPNMALLYTWGEGLVIRYGREPTVLELLTDPILKIAKVRNVMHPEDLQRSLADYARQANERRKVRDRKLRQP